MYALYASTIGMSPGGTWRTSGSVVEVAPANVVEVVVVDRADVAVVNTGLVVVVPPAVVEVVPKVDVAAPVNAGELTVVGEVEPFDEQAANSDAATTSISRTKPRARAAPITIGRWQTQRPIAPSQHAQARITGYAAPGPMGRHFGTLLSS